MSDYSWYVANCNGILVGHDMSEANAKILADEMDDNEPGMEWAALPTTTDGDETMVIPQGDGQCICSDCWPSEYDIDQPASGWRLGICSYC